ncbi:MAG TPA: hypothetical protein VFW73_11785, partial [Lacipirellulaceae bacterium]|nr:hypothetical protein [Lacipirellulaceae bacterium]
EINVTGVHTFTMTSVKINDNLPVELFRPQPAEGTMIADAFDAEGRHTYILGGARAEEAAVARAVEQAKEELSANVAAGIVLDARPVARNASPWIFAFVSLVLCVTAAFFWMRR